MPFKPGQSGNPAGRPKKPELEMLRKAIKKVQKQQGTNLLEHFVQRAYSEKEVLIALMKKVLPDAKQVEVDSKISQNGQLVVKITDYSDNGDKQSPV